MFVTNWTLMKTSSLKGWAILATRYKLPITGKSAENKHLRFHVFMSSVRVTDLTNAGKRGKNVEVFTLYDTDYVSDSVIQAMSADFVMDLKTMTYPQAKKRALNLVRRGQDIGTSSPKIEIRQEKGVRVAPAGFGPFKLETPFVSIDADWDSFTMNDKTDQNNLPSCIPAMDGGKKSVKVFYRWVQDNQNKIKRMTFGQIQQEMRKAGIKSHSYCRMD